jgi:hypothetical protein
LETLNLKDIPYSPFYQGETVCIFLTFLLPMGKVLLDSNRSFLQTDQVFFRKKVMVYLILLSEFFLVKSVWDFN